MPEAVLRWLRLLAPAPAATGAMDAGSEEVAASSLTTWTSVVLKLSKGLRLLGVLKARSCWRFWKSSRPAMV